MDQETKHDKALMRYSVIAPAILGLSDEYPTLTAFFRDASEKGVVTPDGKRKVYAPQTIERWYRDYKSGGFEALVPGNRSDIGKSRKLDEDVQERIKYLKTSYPRMSATDIYLKLIEDGDITKNDVSLSTVNRFIKNQAIVERTTNNQDMRRYERPHINEVWCGDSSVGPYIKLDDDRKHRVYIIALIDDASRFIVGIDVFFNDNFINLMSVIKSAVAKYGRPKVFNFDNGSSYRNKQMDLLAARIGSVVHYDQPYTPTQKAKIERWFRTLKDQWMATLNVKDYHSLDELRESLHAYVQKYNQTVHSSLKGMSPQQRYFSESKLIHRLPEDSIDKCFLLEIERKVSSDSVITIDHIEYEVDYRFAKQHITLRYSPDFKNIFIVEADGTLTPIRLLNKTENAFVKRDKIKLCGGED